MISPSLMQSSHLSKWQHHSPGYVIYYPSKSCYFDTYCFFLLIFTAIIKVQGTVISFQFQNCCFQRLPRLPCSVLHTITRQSHITSCICCISFSTQIKNSLSSCYSHNENFSSHHLHTSPGWGYSFLFLQPYLFPYFLELLGLKTSDLLLVS